MRLEGSAVLSPNRRAKPNRDFRMPWAWGNMSQNVSKCYNWNPSKRETPKKKVVPTMFQQCSNCHDCTCARIRRRSCTSTCNQIDRGQRNCHVEICWRMLTKTYKNMLKCWSHEVFESNSQILRCPLRALFIWFRPPAHKPADSSGLVCTPQPTCGDCMEVAVQVAQWRSWRWGTVGSLSSAKLTLRRRISMNLMLARWCMNGRVCKGKQGAAFRAIEILKQISFAIVIYSQWLLLVGSNMIIKHDQTMT